MAKKIADSKRMLRILDANLNRTKEGLRVAEDICRFLLNSGPLALSFKKMRHDLTKTAHELRVPYHDFLQSRNSTEDVAQKSAYRDKTSVSAKDLIVSNLKRSQEALRVLEECSKMISLKTSQKFQKLRFECYELERKSICQF